jgi:hypothetical protein
MSTGKKELNKTFLVGCILPDFRLLTSLDDVTLYIIDKQQQKRNIQKLHGVNLKLPRRVTKVSVQMFNDNIKVSLCLTFFMKKAASSL